MTSGNSGLRIERLAMSFGGVFVFEDVSIEIPPGRVTAARLANVAAPKSTS